MEKKIIINIGSQFGGGGLGVANELGKKLGNFGFSVKKRKKVNNVNKKGTVPHKSQKKR